MERLGRDGVAIRQSLRQLADVGHGYLMALTDSTMGDWSAWYADSPFGDLQNRVETIQ